MEKVADGRTRTGTGRLSPTDFSFVASAPDGGLHQRAIVETCLRRGRSTIIFRSSIMRPLKITILIPVYDDWPSLLKLAGDTHSARRAPVVPDRM